MPELNTVGHSVLRLDGRDKVTGGAKFVTDLTLTRLLYGKIDLLLLVLVELGLRLWIAGGGRIFSCVN